MMETWQELKVTVKREGEELVSNLMIELGAQGVAIEDSMDYVGNVDRFGEIFPEVEQQEEIVVTAYYPETVIFRMSSVIDKQKSLGKPRLFAYKKCPLQGSNL